MGDLVVTAPAAAQAAGASVRFHCPEDMRAHAREVLRGEYDIPGLEFAKPPRVLDVGANVGAYAVWAMTRWPGASVTCYEPNPRAREFLIRNVRDIDAIRPVAVREPVVAQLSTPMLRLGKNNLGEASFYDLGEQTDERIPVQFLSTDDLPACDVMKVDTEGCELEIIGSYLLRLASTANARMPSAVCFEYHRVGDRALLDEMLTDHGYQLARGRIVAPARGTLCYLRVT